MFVLIYTFLKKIFCFFFFYLDFSFNISNYVKMLKLVEISVIFQNWTLSKILKNYRFNKGTRQIFFSHVYQKHRLKLI